MIYGVSIFLNDVNFKAKNYKEQVQARLSYEAFFTSRKKATDFYLYHKKEWDNNKGLVYGRKDQRGRCEMYKASVQDGQVMNHGITIYKDTI